MRKELSFHFTVEHVEGGYIANCLETGVIATSRDQKDAIGKMVKLIDRHVEFAIRHGRLHDIYVRAPKEVFDKFLSETTVPPSRFTTPVSADDNNVIVNQWAYAV